MEDQVYYIDFDTLINPGKLEATRVTIGIETITDMGRKLDIGLCDHPLYANLEKYVLDNPSKR